MKKLLIISSLFIFSSCNNGNSEQGGTGADNTGTTTVNAGDSVKQPTGMDNSSVISTDTAAINVQNSIRKADSAKQQK